MGHTEAKPKLVSCAESDGSISLRTTHFLVSPFWQGSLFTLSCACIMESNMYVSVYTHSCLCGMSGLRDQWNVNGVKWNDFTALTHTLT